MRKDEGQLTSRIQKGGALLSDMRQLSCRWGEKPPELTPGRFVKDVLPKATQARANDTFVRAFRPRFIEGSPKEAWRLCAAIEECRPSAEIAQAFYYWITARAEPILYRYVTEELWDQSRAGITSVTSPELARWIRRVTAADGKVWSDVVNIKVAQAMLAALRDFGILSGASRKKISAAHLPLESFCLIAFTLREILKDGQDLASHRDWRLFLLSPNAMERLLLESHQHGWLHYQAAGRVTRLEFPSADFPEYARRILDR